ncbi:Endoplasmic reticulum membrane-associated oxidoreductin involved in disulfide bond formation [Phaffia rhodozyma]|uniref:Endoplasmic reticulum membrane-associated oxidoreductin involved in disulfide bond formation n=1 Tax=Phaffia rhodozyma TaxID=264483 RepID=A0A0F7SQX5_PHARH|nr:Endoplasmic reticulum membrane-associated oxidoreductin involved in disulfide bond formation [Phaffia rhodozyma]
MLISPTYLILNLSLTALASASSFSTASTPYSNPLAGVDSKPRSGVVKNVLETKPDVKGYCSPSGRIENTLCEYETLEAVNSELYPWLHRLVQTPFFKYYKIDLYKECPFWYENVFCMNRDCSVETANESDIPEKWRVAALSSITHSSESASHRGEEPGSCHYRDQDFCQIDDESQNEGQFVDLTLNPERFTGYAGLSAAKVWTAIYQENCFGLSELSSTLLSQSSTSGTLSSKPSLGLGGLSEGVGTEMRSGTGSEEEECIEKRVYYRIISGLHASISTHICHEFLDQETGLWHPNLSCFINRIASHPERLQNMYFNMILILRAVSRAGKYLEAYDVCTGISFPEGLVPLEGAAKCRPEETVQEEKYGDAWTKIGLSKVVELSRGGGNGEGRQEVFDEGELFQGGDARILKEEFKERFRNVSRIMDCVGCDKCRLWGKLQVAGVGTALKILFELDESSLDPAVNPNLLSRSEIVALMNTLHRFSESLQAVETFRQMYAKEKETAVEKSSKFKEESSNSLTNQSNLPRYPIPTSSFSTLLATLRQRIFAGIEVISRHLQSWLELLRRTSVGRLGRLTAFWEKLRGEL